MLLVNQTYRYINRSSSISRNFCSLSQDKMKSEISLGHRDENSDEDSSELHGHREITLQQQSSGVLAQKREIFDREGRCYGCFMFQAYCMCRSVRAIFEPVVNDAHSLTSHINFCLFMHFKEWGRASNTGKLLNVGLGDERAGIYIFGQEDQERDLINKLRSKPSLILYPNKNAKPIMEYCHLLDEAKLSGNPLQLCVIDTTWSLSAAMDRNLPDDIPRVMIDKALITGPSRFLNRKQNIHKHKVSTIEAVALALQSLLPTSSTSCSQTNDATSEEDSLPPELHCYRTALEYSVDSVLKQAGKKLAYGHTIVPQFDEIQGKSTADRVHFGPVTKPVMEKPLTCMSCGRQRADDSGIIIDHAVNFKNFGRKWKVFPREEIENLPAGSTLECRKEQFLRQKAIQQFSRGKNVTDTEVSVEFRMWRCTCCRDYFPSNID